jgi:signal transduction histidine kinase
MSHTEPKILWPEVTRFIGQLSHDLRNHLNAVELQIAFLGESIGGPEAKGEIKRLREMTGEMCGHLQKLSATLDTVEPQTVRYPAADFVEDLRAILTPEQSKQSVAIDWKISLGEEMLEIDPELLSEAFVELFANAGRHGRAEGPLVFEVRGEGTAIECSLREPKAHFDGATEDWGARPLQHLRSGHYGLGLFRARSIFEAHHAHYRVHFDAAASVLHTAVSVPARGAS